MMRFLPSFLAVEQMRSNLAKPHEAAATAIARIAKHYPDYVGAIIVAAKDGTYGAACHGMDSFPYSIQNEKEGLVTKTVACLKS